MEALSHPTMCPAQAKPFWEFGPPGMIGMAMSRPVSTCGPSWGWCDSLRLAKEGSLRGRQPTAAAHRPSRISQRMRFRDLTKSLIFWLSPSRQDTHLDVAGTGSEAETHGHRIRAPSYRPVSVCCPCLDSTSLSTSTSRSAPDRATALQQLLPFAYKIQSRRHVLPWSLILPRPF